MNVKAKLADFRVDFIFEQYENVYERDIKAGGIKKTIFY